MRKEPAADGTSGSVRPATGIDADNVQSLKPHTTHPHPVNRPQSAAVPPPIQASSANLPSSLPSSSAVPTQRSSFPVTPLQSPHTQPPPPLRRHRHQAAHHHQYRRNQQNALHPSRPMTQQATMEYLKARISRALQLIPTNVIVGQIENGMQIIFEADPVPDAEMMTFLVYCETFSLGETAISRIKVFGRSPGDILPAWTDEIAIASPKLH